MQKSTFVRLDHRCVLTIGLVGSPLTTRQMSVCLMAVLPVEGLRSAAFSCWTSMLTHLEEEDVEALIETTFIIIREYWSSFDEESREKTRTLLSYLLKDQERALLNTIHMLPSLADIPELSDLWKKVATRRGAPLDTRESFAVFAKRLLHENSGVVERGLVELSDYLRLHQDYLQTSAISEQPDPVVTKLSRVLLDCTSKYGAINARISRLCAECVGFIGCLDSNRLETVRDQADFVVLHNFNEAEETTDFVLFLLDVVLVKSFESTSDVLLQGFLAYVMQELLERCDFTKVVGVQDQNEVARALENKWLRMPEGVREVLTPFLSSRFLLAPMPPTITEYPIYRAGRSYPNWLRQFALDLLHRGQNVFADIIFEPLCRAIRVKDLSIAAFLLPYLVIHVTLGSVSKQSDKDAVWNELLTILQQNVSDNASYSEREDKKLFSEVSSQLPTANMIC